MLVARLRAVVAEVLGLEPKELCSAISLGDELAVDSLDLVEMAIAVEDALAVSLPEHLLASVRTYGDLEAVVVMAGVPRRRLT